MTKTKDIIIKLKEVRNERGLSLTDIMNIMDEKGQYPVSKSTISRVFAEGSEDNVFKYEETLRPIYDALLDIETIEDDDDMDVRAYKSLLKYKIERIEELEQQIERLEMELNKEKLKRHEMLDAEREIYNRRVDFLKSQIVLKDERIDKLMDALFEKDSAYNKLLNQYLSFPYSHIREVKK